MKPPSSDLVVVLPGIMGSTLRHDGHLVWAPSAGSVVRALNTFFKSIKNLQVCDSIGDGHPDDGVEPVGLMPDRHVMPGVWTPVKGYDDLLARLRGLGYREAAAGHDAPPGNLLPIPYDWRLSNRYNGRHLKSIVEPTLERWRAHSDKDAQLVFICHSMGGLVARWYIEQCGGAELTRKLITLGTPYRGAARALDPLVNGIRRELGPFSVELTEFARSMPSLYQLLPEYACFTSTNATGGLAKTTEANLPELDTKMTVDAMAFYTTLQESEAKRPASLTNTHAIVGTSQATRTTAALKAGRVEFLDTYREEDLSGDGTVPGVASCRPDVQLDSNILHRIPDKHGNLQRNHAALDQVESILTARRVFVRDGSSLVNLRVSLPEVVLQGEPVTVEVTPGEPTRRPILVKITNESGRVVQSCILSPTNDVDVVGATLDSLPPGAYSVDAGDPDRSSHYAPVSSDVLVW